MARCERSLRMSVCHSSRIAPSVSNACAISSSFDSVLIAVRQCGRPSMVCPIADRAAALSIA